MSTVDRFEFYRRLAEERITTDLASLKGSDKKQIFEDKPDSMIIKDLVSKLMEEWQLGVDSGLSEAGAYEIAVVECLPWMDPKIYK